MSNIINNSELNISTIENILSDIICNDNLTRKFFENENNCIIEISHAENNNSNFNTAMIYLNYYFEFFNFYDNLRAYVNIENLPVNIKKFKYVASYVYGVLMILDIWGNLFMVIFDFYQLRGKCYHIHLDTEYMYPDMEYIDVKFNYQMEFEYIDINFNSN